MAKPIYILGFCGHRKLPEGHELASVLNKALRNYLKEVETRGGDLHLHSMIAWGADLIAIEQARELGIPVHLILPKHLLPIYPHRPIEGLAEDFLQEGNRGMMEEEWRRAVEVIESCRAGIGGCSLRTLAAETKDPDCYHDTAVKMLSAADGLLAVWDGLPAKGIGGCGETCEYARESGIPTWQVAPDTKTEQLVPPATILKEDPTDPSLTLLKEHHGDTAKFLLSLDNQAEIIGQTFRGRKSQTISLHFYATLLAACAACFVTYEPAKTALILLSLVQALLVTLAWWTQRKIRRSNAHTKWVNLRFAAEITRSTKTTAGLSDPIYPLVADHLPQWSRFARSIAFAALRELPKISWIDRRENYLKERLRGQIAYFDGKKKAADRDSAALRQFLVVATQLAPWVAAAGIAYKVAEKAGVRLHEFALVLGVASLPFSEFGRFLPIALPLIAGYLGSKMQATDAERRRTKYASISAQLHKAETHLRLLKTETSVRIAVEQTEETLLNEQLEWLLKESPSKR